MKSLVILLFYFGVSFGQDSTTTTVKFDYIVSEETTASTETNVVFGVIHTGLMYNYALGKINTVDFLTFDEINAAIYLIQAPTVLDAYKWMRENRKKYSIYECVELVNKWWINNEFSLRYTK